MLFIAGQTAIVIVVPEAEPLVDRWRQQYDASAALGVPAHVTLLYPFLDASCVDEGVVEDLRGLLSHQPAFELRFARTGRFPDLLYLVPEPADLLRAMTATIAARWPEAPPYGGAYPDIIPHLTVAHGVDADAMAVVEHDLAARLPIEAIIDEALLIGFDGVRWAIRDRLAFHGR